MKIAVIVGKIQLFLFMEPDSSLENGWMLGMGDLA